MSIELPTASKERLLVKFGDVMSHRLMKIMPEATKRKAGILSAAVLIWL